MVPNAELDPRLLPPLTLAYIGDAVYELWVRSFLVRKGFTKVNDLHHYAVGFVNADTQSQLVEKLTGFLNEEEATVLKRGRNAKSGRHPKNKGMIEYRRATGLETLVGYLYLLGLNERLEEIFNLLVALVEEETVKDGEGEA
ncbi:MAG: ribonuclease III domain-containing protein [Desulfitobacteriaceae bacterium]|jgi:ribonuclease-3 family protein|nr:ribonuclease III domain-containing protein [Desulfitobacteriaceae bacterium]